jgi:hypothetical protein
MGIKNCDNSLRQLYDKHICKQKFLWIPGTNFTGPRYHAHDHANIKKRGR